MQETSIIMFLRYFTQSKNMFDALLTTRLTVKKIPLILDVWSYFIRKNF